MPKPTIQSVIIHLARIVLGGLYLFAGTNYFLHLVSLGNTHEFLEIMIPSGYFDVVKAIQVIAGILLLSNRFVALALVLITPVTVNIMLFLLLIYKTQLVDGFVLAGCNLLLLWAYRDCFAAIFRPRHKAALN